MYWLYYEKLHQNIWGVGLTTKHVSKPPWLI